MMEDYTNFIKSKKYKFNNYGIEVTKNDVHPKLFDWQKDIVKWACKKGRCAVFLDTGLGKTFIQLVWLGIQETNTLQFSKSRGVDNESDIHIG